MPCDKNLIRTPDEFGYQQELLRMIERIRTYSVSITDVQEAPCALPRPTWDLYFPRNRKAQAEKMLFEVRGRIKCEHDNPNGATYFSPWKNTEYFSMPCGKRGGMFFPLAKWWQVLESSRFSPVPLLGLHPILRACIETPTR